MASSKSETICRYLTDMIAAKEAFERHFSAMSEEGDDDEIRDLFASCATRQGRDRTALEQRLQILGGRTSGFKTALAQLFSAGHTPAQLPHTVEERIVQNLVAGYTIEAAECGMFESFLNSARDASDWETARLVAPMQRAAHEAADRIWSLIPSRSLIAYNILTVSEIDPAVETKVGEATWTA